MKVRAPLVLSSILVMFVMGCSSKNNGNSERGLDVRADPPSGLTAQAGDGQVQLSWSEAPDAVTYNVYWSNESGVSPVEGRLIENVSSPYVHTALENDQAYSYVVTSVSQGLLESATSNEVTVTPNPPPAGAPQVEIVPGYQRISLWWDPVPEANAYQVFVSESPGVDLGQGREVTLPPAVIPDLTVGRTYYFVVASVNSAGQLTPSLENSGSPVPLTLSPPGRLTVRNNGLTNSLKWSAVPLAEQYRIYWDTARSVNKADDYFLTADPSYTHAGLQNGGRYYYRVVALGGGGQSPMSREISIVARAVPPDAPTNLNAVAENAGITLSWDPMEGASAYNLYYDVDGETTAVVNVESPFQHTGLEDQAYSYTVTGVVNDIESQPSSAVSATPLFFPSTPANFTAQSGENLIQLNWSEVSNATGYILYWHTTGDVDESDDAFTNVDPPFVHDGLAPGDSYFYRVASVNADGKSELSEQREAQPIAPLADTVDLVISDVVIDKQAGETVTHGESIAVSFTVTNNGTVSTAEQTPWSGGFFVGFDLVKETLPNDISLLWIAYYDYFVWVGDLGPGESYSGTYSLAIPKYGDYSNILNADGTYFVKVHADAWNNQLERNENNNEIFLTDTPLNLAADDNEDLQINSLSISDTALVRGQSFDVQATVLNTGTSDTYANWVKFYLVDSSEPPINLTTAVKIGDYKLEGIAAGQQAVINEPLALPYYVPDNVSPGSYYLAAHVDADNQQEESDETNNWLIQSAVPLSVEGGPTTPPEIVFQNVSISPSGTSLQRRQPVKATVTLENRDPALRYVDPERNSDEAVLVDLMVKNADANDFFSSNRWAMPSPGPGATLTFDTWLFNGNYSIHYMHPDRYRWYYAQTPGDFEFKFTFADLPLRDERAFQVPLVENNSFDLVISAFDIDKTDLASGDDVNVSLVVSNIGTADSGGFYIHLNLGGRYQNWFADIWIPHLPAGASSSRLVRVQIPSVASGDYELMATTGYFGLNDADETNNTVSVPVTVNNDVDNVVTDVQLGPNSELWGGGNIEVSFSVRNDGSQPSFFGYPSATVGDTVDYPLTLENYNKTGAMLAPGETGTVRFTTMLPFFLNPNQFTLHVEAATPSDSQPENNSMDISLNIESMEAGPDGFPINPSARNHIVKHDSYFPANGTYVIDSIRVEPGAMLRIKEGATLRFTQGAELYVEGALLVEGAPGSNVIFTSNSANPAKGDWQGIRVTRRQQGNLIMQYAIVEFAETGVNYDEGELFYSQIRNNVTGVLMRGFSFTRLERCTVENNTMGILVDNEGSVRPVQPLIYNNNIANDEINLQAMGFQSAGGASTEIVTTGNYWGFDNLATIGDTILDAADGQGAGEPTVIYDDFSATPLELVY